MLYRVLIAPTEVVLFFWSHQCVESVSSVPPSNHLQFMFLLVSTLLSRLRQQTISVHTFSLWGSGFDTSRASTYARYCQVTRCACVGLSLSKGVSFGFRIRLARLHSRADTFSLYSVTFADLNVPLQTGLGDCIIPGCIVFKKTGSRSRTEHVCQTCQGPVHNACFRVLVGDTAGGYSCDKHHVRDKVRPRTSVMLARPTFFVVSRFPVVAFTGVSLRLYCFRHQKPCCGTWRMYVIL